ncbi:hypothetical protein [Chlorobium sp. N1]|uniref:hypothetical protein n=1 Tax=Chlorobium sp. N1 TaxID=2491138 RepID=UPI00103BCB42|nr:hypothetical protein [Chlorobium sp. N1]TCD48119.1 hypothetical protein E0L29_04315 [Chlorobium sp. N1]
MPENHPARLPLLVGAAYFLLVSLAHAAGLKVPGLFVYFSVPSLAYQDRIISLLAFGWASFLLATAVRPSPSHLLATLVSGLAAIGMLLRIDLTTPFASIDRSIEPRWFLAETLMLALYWCWLLLAALRTLRR